MSTRGRSDALPQRIYHAEVLETRRLTPGMMRIVLGGEDLAGFATTGVGDEYIRLFLPEPGRREPVYPEATEDSWTYPDGVEPSPMRTYTIRSVDPDAGRVTVDFVCHPGGVAAEWALAARPGDPVGFNTPTGLYELPAGATWQLLLADATGLPAAARLIEDAPAGIATRAVLEVSGAGDEQRIAAPVGAEVAWLHGGNGLGPSQLAEVLRGTTLPEGPGYVWVAGETRVTRDTRKYLRRELGLPATAFKVIGYWTDQAEEWRARFDAQGPEFRNWLEQLWDQEQHRDVEDIIDEVDEAYAARGL